MRVDFLSVAHHICKANSLDTVDGLKVHVAHLVSVGVLERLDEESAV